MRLIARPFPLFGFLFFSSSVSSFFCEIIEEGNDSNVTGISSLASCGEVDALPELPAQDEERLQRAARLLQQRLVLRQWLTDHGLHSHYQK